MQPLKYIALVGNVLYILWIAYNAIDDGFHGATPIEMVVLPGLLILLIINSIVLIRPY